MINRYRVIGDFSRNLKEQEKIRTSKELSYSIKRIVNELNSIYEVKEEYRGGNNLVFLNNRMIQFSYLEVGIHDMIDNKWRDQYERTIGLTSLYIAEDKKRMGHGSEFLRNLLYCTSRVAGHVSYILIPYLDPKDEEYNVGLGKFYLKCGGRILRSSIEKIDKPHVELNKELAEAGIGPIGFTSMKNWNEPDGLSLYVADEDEYTPLQKRYFEEKR